jgi:hypothetical protein
MKRPPLQVPYAVWVISMVFVLWFVLWFVAVSFHPNTQVPQAGIGGGSIGARKTAGSGQRLLESRACGRLSPRIARARKPATGAALQNAITWSAVA